MALKSYLTKSNSRIQNMLSLLKKKDLTLLCDKLKDETNVDHDVIYYKKSNTEEELLFVFGFDFFVKELEDQEFKRSINQNFLDFIILKAYLKAVSQLGTQNRVRISDILNNIQDKEKDSLELHAFIEKILTQSYYLGWKIEKDNNAIENDYFIEIPNNFLVKVKQRFNLDIIEHIHEDENTFLFLNGKGKLILVFKNLDIFSKTDIKSIVNPLISKIFEIKEIKTIK